MPATCARAWTSHRRRRSTTRQKFRAPKRRNSAADMSPVNGVLSGELLSGILCNYVTLCALRFSWRLCVKLKGPPAKLKIVHHPSNPFLNQLDIEVDK